MQKKKMMYRTVDKKSTKQRELRKWKNSQRWDKIKKPKLQQHSNLRNRQKKTNPWILKRKKKQKKKTDAYKDQSH